MPFWTDKKKGRDRRKREEKEREPMKKRNCLLLVILLVLIMPAGTLAYSRDPKILEWLRKNADIEEGKIELTKYPGEYETRASILYKITDIDASYSSYFKNGIVTYDQELDEHYYPFHSSQPL